MRMLGGLVVVWEVERFKGPVAFNRRVCNRITQARDLREKIFWPQAAEAFR